MCIMVGDVVGRGLSAAVEMGRLRHALRAYTLDTSDPAELLHRLDRQVRQFEPEVMATVLCAVVDPSGEQMRLSTAGHPPPVVSGGPDLPAAILDLPADLPIGVRPDAGRRVTTVALPPGTAMCLYTDGLVERRGQPLDTGLDALTRAMSAGPAETVCAAVMQALVGAESAADDIAVLVLRRQPRADTGNLTMQLPAASTSLKPLRTAMRRWLSGLRADRRATADLLTAVGEACANAIEHAYGPGEQTFELTGSRQGDEIELVVRDHGRWRPPRGQNRGRGLGLMETFMDVVEVTPGETGTEVRMTRRITG
jgi:anti-sigma regulatory factor (Ser/Thr protein kinase)